MIISLQCLDTVGGAAPRHPACKKLSGELLAWLSVWSEGQTCIQPSWCYCHSLSLASVKSRLVLPFWYRLTRVVPEKGPLNVCVCVCVCVRACVRVCFVSWNASNLCLVCAISGLSTTACLRKSINKQINRLMQKITQEQQTCLLPSQTAYWVRPRWAFLDSTQPTSVLAQP